MSEIIYTNVEHTLGRMVHAYTDTGVPSETVGPIPPQSGPARAVYDRLIADGVVPQPYAAPDERPRAVSMSQLIRGLRQDGFITAEEATAWATRTSLPAAVEAVIAQLPADEQVDARVAAFTMTEAHRDHPLLVGAAKVALPDATDEEIIETLADAFARWEVL